MSKPSRRPTREARKAHQVKVKAARQRLASQQKATGVVAPNCQSVPNRLSPYQSIGRSRRPGKKRWRPRSPSTATCYRGY